ncbi:MAG: hypothetical protein IPJ71_04815 [Bdellovibrionales bacterium]|nr:hypothetical protein [Bdellovibrionales bacterium]
MTESFSSFLIFSTFSIFCAAGAAAQESAIAYSVGSGKADSFIEIKSEMMRVPMYLPKGSAQLSRDPQDITYLQEAIERARIVTGQSPGVYVFSTSQELKPHEIDFLNSLKSQKIHYRMVVPESQSVAISTDNGGFGTDPQSLPITGSKLEEFKAQLAAQVASEEKAPTKGLDSWWKSVYSRPTKGELYQGVTLAASNGLIAGSIWLSLDGVSPWVASAMTAGITLYELIFATHIRTYDNIVGHFRNQTRHQFNFEDGQSWNEIAIRFAHSTFMSYLWKALGGAVGSSHSLLTLQGNIEVLVNGIAKFPGYWLGAAKSHNLSRKASAWVGFPLFLLGPVLSKLDLFGVKMLDLVHFDPIAIGNVVIYQPSLPIIGLALLYGGTAALIHWGPNQAFETFANRMDDLSARGGATLKSVMGRFHFRSHLTSWTGRLVQSCKSLLLNQSTPAGMKENI